MEDRIFDAVNEVHDELGSGFTETIYHSALSRELSERGIAHTSEVSIPVFYKGVSVGRRRPDMFIMNDDGEKIITELKAGSSSGEKQLDQYMDIISDDDNYTDIVGGCLIRFNNPVAVIDFV